MRGMVAPVLRVSVFLGWVRLGRIVGKRAYVLGPGGHLCGGVKSGGCGEKMVTDCGETRKHELCKAMR
jgi:hypothetical protein